METSSKKMKLSNHNDFLPDEDNDELKVEKFYALIRSNREARGHLIDVSHALKQERGSNRNKRKLQDLQLAAWKPCFQPEDFLPESERKNPSATLVDTSKRTEVPEKQEAKEELDLRLSL